MRASNFARLLVALVAASCWSATSFAQPTPVREMMEESGMVEQFGDLGEQSADGARQAAGQQAGLPPDFVDALADAAAQAFEGARFLADLEAGLAENLTAAEIAAMTAFYRSPLGQRIRAAEVAASTKEVRAEIAANAAALRAELDTQPERHAIFERMDKALLATEMSATMVRTMMYGMLLGMLEKQGQPIERERLDMVERQIEGAEAMIVTQLRQEVQASFVRGYRDVTIADLEAYAGFVETETARAVYAAIYATTDEIFVMRSRELGQGLAAAMRQKRT
jgi:hypothetical protein